MLNKAYKGIIAAALSAVIGFTSIPFAAFGADLTVTKSGGWYEYAFARWNGTENATVEYKEASADDSSYTAVDSELIRGNRVDIPGLKGDTEYTIKITSEGSSVTTTVKTMSYSRDGYAHYNKSSIGAYNNDGTLKSDASVIYVTNDNKNTVKYGNYTGIASILQNAGKIQTPLAIRFIGKVDTQTRDADGTKTTDKNNGVVEIKGLVDQDMGDDSNFNMCEVKGGSNITLEGIGTDALIEKWGFNIKGGASSYEIRNLGFALYPEDAVGIESASNIWLHNNDFESGENKYDLTNEQDKHYGDGSTDIKKSNYITVSDSYYHNGHKTSLVGASTSQQQDYITFARNVFDSTAERTPRVRNAHVHVYNNYYKDVTGYGIGASHNSKVFSEANYFENTNIPITMGPVGSDKYGGTVKSYGDIFVDCYEITNPDSAKTGISYTEAASRDEKTSIANPKSGGDAYDNFDIDSSVFYYNDYSVLTAAEAKEHNMIYSGRLNEDSGYNTGGGYVPPTDDSTSTTESTTVSENSSESTTESIDSTSTESTSESTTESVTESGTESTTNAPVSDLVITDGLFAGVDYGNIFVLEDMPFTAEETVIDGVVYPGWVAGSNNPSTSNDVPTKGAAIKLTPQYDGVFNVTFKLNGNKSYYFVESDGTRIDTESNGSEQSVYFNKTYNVIGGKEYYLYCKGSKIPVYAMSLTEEKPQPPITLLYGDADNSGVITSNDAAAVLTRTLNNAFVTVLEATYPDIAYGYLDVNADGTLTAADAALILNKTLNSDIVFPIEKQ